MFSSENSPNGTFSLHRSPPYASKTPPAPRGASESGGSVKSPSPGGGRLQLTLKTPSYASKASPVIERFVDPSPDWSLQDLQSELDVIATRYTSTVSLDNDESPPHSSTNRGLSWREFSVTADFGRTSGPFRMCAFDSDSETDSGDEEVEGHSPSVPTPSIGIKDQKATSRTSEDSLAVAKEDVWGSSPLLARTGYVESALIELERERHSRVQEEFRKRRLILDNALREEVQREAALLARVENDKEAKCELARRSDKQDQRQIAELRDEHLSALQRDHELRSQFEARQIRREAAEEEARRQEIAAREERTRQIKARMEAEKEKAEADAAKRKAQAEAAAAAATKRAEDDRKAKEDLQQSAKEKEALQKSATQKEPTIKATTGLKPKVAPTAAKLEESRLQNLQAFQDVYAPLRANPAHQKELKTYERQIVKYLQQIAATQEQVNIKSRDLLQLLNDTRVPTQFLIVTLGSKLLSQIESQVLKLPSYAFALAQVIVNLASQVPLVMDVVLAKLHEVCIYTVPKYYVFTKDQFESDAGYYKALGYREEDGKMESTDDYVARMAAYMTFYGAMVQTEVAGGQNPHGLAAGWAWTARLLNNILADRNTASALEAFLKMAGFRLYQVYQKPFMRVMQAIVTEFIEKLKVNGDADARAVVSRLETYLHLQKYLQEPEGRKMPATDVSSSLKA